MTMELAATQNTDIQLSDGDFQFLSRLAKQEFGLNLTSAKKPLVHSRLSRRLQARGLVSYQSYFELLKHPNETQERSQFLSSLTTNVTSFFREAHHFKTLQDTVPMLRDKIAAKDRVRIWSAGCSTGPEPYSIAMSLSAIWPDIAKRDVKVLATDLDQDVLTKAKTARFSMAEFESLPQEFKQPKYTKRFKDGFELTEHVKSMVKFAELNLMNTWPFNGPFDAIFCRNVAIYFDKTVQQRLWARLTEKLTDCGILFIGHSERVTGPASDLLQPIGVTSYKRIS